jgi:predicted glycoside hydrolase/deacetylase ChbG (UPF0249 family)
MPRQKYLIVNADDFGQSPGVNQGIIEAHERGIVTSASLMVHWPAALEAAEYNRAHPQLSLGLHLDLGEWFYRDGNWMPLYERVLLTESQAVSEEVSRQLALFRQLVGKPPSHLDSHQHVHRREPVRSVMLSLAQDLGVPLRGCHANVRSSGDFYGQTADGCPVHEVISVEGLLQILANLPTGITELTCHPGEPGPENDLDGLETMYRMERGLEVKVLCDPRVRMALDANEIQLCSFHTIRHGAASRPA